MNIIPQFYRNKFYNKLRVDQRYYIPLTSVKVDLDRLRTEVTHIINPESIDYGITTTERYVTETPHNFKRYTGVSRLNNIGERRVESGETDEEIIHWPLVLEGTYIQELAHIFSDLIKIPSPRVRLSKFDNWKIPNHTDPHTPFRIHIALETHPDALWTFIDRNGNERTIHQPADGVPVLIDTGLTKHGISVTNQKYTGFRTHLWYQFHGVIAPEILEQL